MPENLLTVCGLSSVRAVAAETPELIERLFFDDAHAPLFSEACRFLAQERKTYRLVTGDELRKITDTTHHQGAAAVIHLPVMQKLSGAKFAGHTLCLNDVMNPHNVGAIVRTAAFFGVQNLIVSRKSYEAAMTQAAWRVAEGGLEHVETVHCAQTGDALRLVLPPGSEARSAQRLTLTPEGSALAPHLDDALLPPALAAHPLGRLLGRITAKDMRERDLTGEAVLRELDAYVAPGERGEIVVHGPNVMAGYWNAEEANRGAFNADGYFRTGDVGFMDAAGWVSIVDRTKDMLLCSGFNVYPRTIEEAIYAHPSVAEVCVIGIPDEYRGQSPKAFIALKAGASAFTLDELKAFLKDRIGKHEMVGAMEIRDTLPKTPVGKLSKKPLVDEEAAARKAA